MKYPVLLFFAVLTLPAIAVAQEIRISVSDLLVDTIRETLREEGEDADADFQVGGIGSLPALERLRANEVDLAVIAVPTGEPVPREEFSVHPFAYEVTVVGVNSSNPLEEISMGQLAGVFGSEEETNITSWGDLDLPGWGNRSINPMAVQDEAGISLELFKYSVFEGRRMKGSVLLGRESEIRRLLSSDASAIAVFPEPPEDDEIKTLMVAEGPEAPAFSVSEQNAHYGDYPIRLPFYVAYSAANEERLKPVFRALFDDGMAEALRADGVLPLPDPVRSRFLLEMDLQELRPGAGGN